MINFCRSSLLSLFLLFIYLFVFGESPAFAAPGELCGGIGGIVRMQDATIPQRGGGSLNAKIFAPDASQQTAQCPAISMLRPFVGRLLFVAALRFDKSVRLLQIC